MGEPLRVGFCVSGQGRLFRAALRHREQLGIRPSVVVLGHSATPELEGICAAAGARSVRLPKGPREAVNEGIAAALGADDPGLVVLTFDHLIMPPVVQQFRRRMINLHMALLPAFPGFRAPEKCLRAGARFAGVTMHEVAEGVDDGAVIAQCVLGTRPSDTPAALGARMFNLARLMYLQVIRWYAEGRVYHDPEGRPLVRDAAYGELPISPAVEQSFPD